MADARPPSAGAAAILVAPTAAGSDRLVVMADGRVVAQGDVAAIVGAARVTVVETAGWAGAFEAIERAGKVAGLAGRSLRVPGADPALTREMLGPIQAKIYTMPATLEERFLELTQIVAI